MDKLVGPVYFDTNIFIYALEGHEAYQAILTELFTQVAAENLATVTSEITLAECLVKPIKDGSQPAIAQYKQHITTNHLLDVKPISRSILINAAHLRCELGAKLPDAIHLATAVATGCKTFISNDKKLKVPEGMQALCLQDLVT